MASEPSTCSQGARPASPWWHGRISNLVLMPNTSNIDQITLLAEGIVQAKGFILVDARFSQQGAKRTLEVAIHRPGGNVGLTDCEEISRELEALLDQKELIAGAFLLEVQSPGIDRELKTEREFTVFSGHPVEIKTKDTVAGLGQHFQGVLLGQKGTQVTIGNPKPITQPSKSSKKKAAAVTTEAPAMLTLEMNKLIHIRLHPEAPPVVDNDCD